MDNALETKARQGDISAMKELGMVFKKKYTDLVQTSSSQSAHNNGTSNKPNQNIKTEYAKQAYYWLSQAGENGDAIALYELANDSGILETALGIELTPSKSTFGAIMKTMKKESALSKERNRLYEASAQMGYAPAQCEVAASSILNNKKAIANATAAAQQGYAPAQYLLASWYEQKRGGLEYSSNEDRIEKAKYWYSQAAKQNYKDASEKVRNL